MAPQVEGPYGVPGAGQPGGQRPVAAAVLP